MLLTFLVPTYNRAALVVRAIESVLQQRAQFMRGFEIVVVDDGSTDGTTETLQRYAADPDVVIIRSPRNQGLGPTRNLGFGRARGTWCVLLDSDNALLPGVARTLEKELSVLPPDVGVFWGHSQDASGQSVVSHNIVGRVAGIDTLRRPLPGEHFSVIRTELARRYPYPSLGIKHACEPAFWAQMALTTDFWVSAERFQFYETTGEDRFCAIDNRIRGAKDRAICFAETARIVRAAAPRSYWEHRGRVALYHSLDGAWLHSIGAALPLVTRLWHSWRNAGVVALCVAGPWASRWYMRRRDLSMGPG